jgi:hypothetical protein
MLTISANDRQELSAAKQCGSSPSPAHPAGPF